MSPLTLWPQEPTMRTRRIFAAIAVVVIGCSDTTPTDPQLGLTSGPKLLSCPSATPLTGTFVADPLLGGSLSLAGTSVTIPPGGVSLPTLFVLTIPASPYMEIEVHADGLTSFIFNQPATISIDYSRCGHPRSDKRSLQAWYLDSVTKALLENMNGTDDRVAERVTFTTGHLSGYGVAY